VMSIPTLIVFKDGEAVEQLVWVQTKEKLNETIAKYK
jgi:thioredoxin-like negative regulator of GroEL